MLGKLLTAYEEIAKGTKTLIFNNGINTSLYVYETFKKAGYNIRHLDNKNNGYGTARNLGLVRRDPGCHSYFREYPHHRL